VAEIVPIATPAVPQNKRRANQLDRGCDRSGCANRAQPNNLTGLAGVDFAVDWLGNELKGVKLQ
jgi:hypothetical protein